MQTLDCIDNIWEGTGDGPLVTLDAGPNVHLLYRLDQLELARQIARQLPGLNPELRILSSYEMSRI